MIRQFLNQHPTLIRTLGFLYTIGIFLHFHGGIFNFILAILVLSIPVALCYGLLTNLFIPSGSRRDYYRSRTQNDYTE